MTFHEKGETLTFIGDICNRKRQAECSAALKALSSRELIDSINLINSIKSRKLINSIKSRKPIETSNNEESELDFEQFSVDCVEFSNNHIYVLVDYENINKISKLQKMKAQSTQEICVLTFAGHCNSKSLKSNFVIESSIKDAVDHYISFYIGKLVNQHKHDKMLSIFVLTKDHYASAYSSFTEHKNISITHCPSENKCISMLENLLEN